MHNRRIRIAAVGDQLLAGAGDARAIGWWGRVLARTQAPDVELENYVLAVPHETTEDLNERWWGEASRRFSEETENRLVVALSDADLDLEATSTARSRLNLANVLDTASQRNIPVLVVGPTPTLDEQRNAGSPSSTPPTWMWPTGATTCTWTRSPRWWATSSGARTWPPARAGRARRATGSSRGSCCIGAGTSGSVCPSPRPDVTEWTTDRLVEGRRHEQACTQASRPPQERRQPRQASQRLIR